ncbi:MAG: DUF4179 domain-containing protein [Bacillota bacterium]|nr:DUF4179 domain-containing protein [Bacillota bacterium]MDW7684600.1 DUF4179 domain-containing protein [Bacillota bacterium]
MKCEDVRTQILEELISPEAGRHLEQCAECRSFLATLQRMKLTVRNGLDTACSPKGLNHKKPPKRVRPLLAVASILLAILIILPFVSPTVARQLEKLPFVENIFRNDEGLREGYTLAGGKEYSVTENGVTFTVHRVVADPARTVFFYSIEGEIAEPYEIEPPRTAWRYGGSGSTHRRETAENGYTGQVELHGALDQDIEIARITLTSQDGVQWPLDIPVEFIQEFEGNLIEGLSVERDGFKLEATVGFGITGTRLDWQVTDIDGIFKKEGRGKIRLSSGFPDSLQFLEMRVQLMSGKQSLRGPYFSGGGGSGISVSSDILYEPITDRTDLKVRAEGFIVGGKPLKVRARKFLWRWNTPAFWLHDTFTRWERVNLRDDKTVITLKFIHGRLAELDDFYLVDRLGNRYELVNSELTIPDLEAAYTKASEDFRAGKITDINLVHNRLEKYYELQFEPLPQDERVFTLHADTVLYKSKTVLEIPVPAE